MDDYLVFKKKDLLTIAETFEICLSRGHSALICEPAGGQGQDHEVVVQNEDLARLAFELRELFNAPVEIDGEITKPIFGGRVKRGLA